MIKGKFPREKEFWILLDWKGHIAKAYEFQSDATNVVIFDSDGQLRHQAYGRVPGRRQRVRDRGRYKWLDGILAFGTRSGCRLFSNEVTALK